jgi:hypothetical protein
MTTIIVNTRASVVVTGAFFIQKKAQQVVTAKLERSETPKIYLT